ENDRDFNSQIGANLSVGYRFASPWAIELSSFKGNAAEIATGTDADVSNVRLEALYYIWEDRFSPYAAFGAGRTKLDASDNVFDRHTNTFNLGGGFHYRMLGNLSFRGDLRFLRDHGQADNDVMLSAGLTYHFENPTEMAAPVSLRRELDSDGDGVMDSNDRCPNTARGQSVNEFGCHVEPAEKAPVAETFSVRLEVNFETDSAVVSEQYFAEIERVAKYLKSNPNARVMFEGHTDGRGSEAYNQVLSSQRAQAVADVLVEKFGISSNRVSSEGFGESVPLAENDTAENMAMNRRVIAVISQ
ncbi:MAG TPA: OmpA family protein, partial [Pseudomonadales bacterium]|nr:OmpA family protein [Pseudomonadales bacterium]